MMILQIQKVQKNESSFLNSNEKQTEKGTGSFYEKENFLFVIEKLTTNWSRHSATRTFRHAGAFYYNLAHIDKNEQKKISKKFKFNFL